MGESGQWWKQMLLMLLSVWKPVVSIDVKRLLLALRNKQKTEPPFLPPSVQNTVSQMQTLGLIKKRSIIFLLVSYGCWLGCRLSSKGYTNPSSQVQTPGPCLWGCLILIAGSANEWIFKWLFNLSQQSHIGYVHCHLVSSQWIGFSVQ